MIKRGEEMILTKGNTEICAGDSVILSVPPYNTNETEQLQEKRILSGDKWCNKSIAQLHLSRNELIAMVIRGEEAIIPDGKTVLKEQDVVVMYRDMAAGK